MSNSMINSNPKRTKGRRKIEIKKIINESKLQVSFSKRRNGVFKKASELSTLCGVEVALVVFSPSEKAYSFGHPNVNAVIDRYHMRSPSPTNSWITEFNDAYQNATVRGLNAQITRINEAIEAEKKKSDELDNERKEAQKQFWMASSIEDMSPTQLDQYKLALDNLMKNLDDSAPADNPHPRFFAGGSSSNNESAPTNNPNPHFFEGDFSSNNESAHADNPHPHFFAGGSSSSNNPPPHPHFFGSGSSSSNHPPLLLQQPPCPPPSPQLFPIHPPQAPQVLQNSSMMFHNHMFDGDIKVHHPTFNNMRGFGPRGGFF
ncbi:hypothetical protein RIF29_22632 [Crotalaria pallida]|uniref:MADS-box domain-containing protein n=1 Tax=Crotalaria pallida TaxID=3830 RepID=A0AAN9IAH7_CROPI